MSKLPGGWVSARHILFTLVVGYFAYAQYDGVFLSLRGSVATKQSPGRVEVYGVYSPYFFRGIAAVATLLRNDSKAIVR